MESALGTWPLAGHHDSSLMTLFIKKQKLGVFNSPAPLQVKLDNTISWCFFVFVLINK